MGALLRVTDSEGHSETCDARCYNAIGPDCSCICGGENHGKGFDFAKQNTHMHGMDMMDKFETERGVTIVKHKFFKKVE
jgi:hypothetical protein